jgi:hypothetical protein
MKSFTRTGSITTITVESIAVECFILIWFAFEFALFTDTTINTTAFVKFVIALVSIKLAVTYFGEEKFTFDFRTTTVMAAVTITTTVSIEAIN